MDYECFSLGSIAGHTAAFFLDEQRFVKQIVQIIVSLAYGRVNASEIH